MTNGMRPPTESITPPDLYWSRRAVMRAGVLGVTTVATGLIYRRINHVGGGGADAAPLAELSGLTRATSPSTGPAVDPVRSGFRVDEPMTSLADVTHYNNYYEFSTDKDGVADAAKNFKTDGWKIDVAGLVNKPTTFDLDDLRKISRPEERVYRMRCVEAWSMVIPWAGFSLSKLLDRVEPRSDAKYVSFTTLLDRKRFPNQTDDVLPWPYTDGLRMDEAMHPLTLMATGIYGRELPAQDGAPVRLVVPWKYGFKGVKSIVKIELTATQPVSTWNVQWPKAYGFYANVNPAVDHPRWSQATERRIGGDQAKSTLMFNGYGEQVASLYAGMDLRANY